jgi:HPt (histidine-containing phosphotransfer) domain-containing protein
VDNASNTFSSEDLLAMIGSDFAMLRELRDIFEDEAPRVLNDILDAVITGDAAALEHHTHLMKNVVATVGGRSCRDLAQSLEQAARKKNLDVAPEMAERLGNELDALRAALAAFVASQPNS